MSELAEQEGADAGGAVCRADRAAGAGGGGQLQEDVSQVPPTAPPEPDAQSQGDVEPAVTAAGAEPERGEPSCATAMPDESPTPDAEPSELASLVASVASLDERLRESQRLLMRQSDLVDRLHAENQRLRAGELRAAILPLVRDLLRLYDDIGRLPREGEHGHDLDVVQVGLLDALARNGITAFEPATGDQFDPKQHSAAGVLETADASRDRAIAEVIRVGFQWEDARTIRVADVRVYKHSPDSGSGSAGQMS
jgi:molecular chaperone GrpE (heat shock protein)